MGWATKKSRIWEIRQLTWTFISVLFFMPLPIHIHPLVMMNQASKSKVRSWYIVAWMFLLVELSLFGSFVYFWGAMSQGMLLTIGGSALSYIVGHGLLLNQAKPYLQRLELAEVRELKWITSISSQKHLELAPPTVDTPQYFIERLMYWRQRIGNRSIHRDIDKIIRLFHLLEKRDRLEAERFLVRHSTIINVLMQYGELQDANLNNETSRASKQKLEKVLQTAAEAIEQEVTNHFKIGMLEVSAETDMYLQTLKSRNLIKEQR